MRKTLALAALSLCAAPLMAQTQAHAFTLPEVFTGSKCGGGNYLPFSRTRGFIQYFHDGDNWPSLLPPFIRKMGVRTTAASHGALAPKIEIYISNTSVSYGSISTTYANNLGTNSTKWLAMKTLNIAANNAVDPSPDVPFYWIPGDVPFQFNNAGGKEPNIIIQFDIQTATTYATSGIISDSMSSANGFYNTDASCGGTLTMGYSANNLTFNVTGAVPNNIVIYFLGAHLLPGNVDVGYIFGPKCTFMVNPLLILPATTDASGAHSWNAPWVPSKASALHVQAAHRSTTTATGLATTNCTHVKVGTAGIATYLYNWTRDGTTCEYGPYTTDRGPAFLFNYK